MKKNLGLDIGTNSIGWAFIEKDDENDSGKIIGMGSYIIPTDAEMLGNYEAGLAASKNATRRQARGARRVQQRYKLRRQRLIKALKLLQWLPEDFLPGHKLAISQSLLAEMKVAFNSSQVSEDWVVYYLRHKALTQRIELSELARVLYHMNQRRGFKSNRKANNEAVTEEEVEDGSKKRQKKIEIVSILRVENTGEQSRGQIKFNIYLKDGRVGTIVRRTAPEWQGEMELEITYIPPGKKDPERYEFRIPEKTDWQKSKEALEKDITEKDLFVGDYFFKELLKNPGYRIKERIIDRKYYTNELQEIIHTQIKFHPEIDRHSAIQDIAATFYPKNLNKQKEIRNNNLEHLFLNDIIHFQRPLKSQKSSIAECRYETKNVRLKDGTKPGIKVAPTSSPIFQEFRIWQTINNIRVWQREYRDASGRLYLEFDVSDQFLQPIILEKLFQLFDNREKVSQKQILKEIGNLEESKYMINLFRQAEDKELPANETKAMIRRSLKRAGLDDLQSKNILDNPPVYNQLWHLLYSLDQQEHIAQALERPPFFLDNQSAGIISRTPTFKQQYASLSAKAISRLLPLMRSGKYWKEEDIHPKTLDRIEKIMTGEFDEGISEHTRDIFGKMNLTDIAHFTGFQIHLAAYAVYGVHSEKNTAFYDSPDQIQPLGQHELRNPIVTQVVNETLKVVQDIWKTYGRPDQIHIELARELKKNAKERQDLSKMMSDNKRENDRIAAILRELKWGNPNSLGDIEKLKLWEKQADEEARKGFQDVKFKRPSEPTKDEIQKYKLWCEQKHLSPYSGKIIPISELFSSRYQVDHIIPRSRYFDDSFDNKVVVEAWLNDEKDNRTAYRYIQDRSAHTLSREDYEALVNRLFFGKKKRLLLSEEVPDGFISRQLNDTKYISKKLHELLRPVAKNQNDPLIVTGGAITSELKNRWGLGEKMKEAVKWRFERLEEKTQSQLVRYVDELKDDKPTGKRILKLQGYEKRIDHRHHALDAVVIACTTRSHIQYLNTLNAHEEERKGLSYLLENTERGKTGVYKFKQPWKGFVNDVENKLAGIIVSFKNRIRLSGKKRNRHMKFIQQKDGSWVKGLSDQHESKSTYIRQSLHKATFAGKISLRDYKTVSIDEAIRQIDAVADKSIKNTLRDVIRQHDGDLVKIKKYLKANPVLNKDGNSIAKTEIIVPKAVYVNRVSVDGSFDEKKINKIPDIPLRNAMRAHLAVYKDPKEAFSGEGMEAFNKNRAIPLKKVRIMEESSSKFEISAGKWVEADKGTNLFFVIYEKMDEPGKRDFASIPLRDVIRARTEGDGEFVEVKPGYRHFLLSPGDLVYMPDEHENIKNIDWEKDLGKIAGKVYKLVSVNKAQAFFIPQTVSKVVLDKIEFDSTNKVERALDGRMIKQHCIKLKVSRLGQIAAAY